MTQNNTPQNLIIFNNGPSSSFTIKQTDSTTILLDLFVFASFLVSLSFRVSHNPSSETRVVEQNDEQGHAAWIGLAVLSLYTRVRINSILEGEVSSRSVKHFAQPFSVL